MPTSKDILYSAGKNDECFTPRYGVLPIVKHIKARFSDQNITVWCPFDKEDSEFVKVLKENGFKVIASHIDNGQDFYTYEPKEHWDCIISNPPFCFDEKTEIYTKNGWKNYITLSENDEVLSLNPHTQEIEWSNIESINLLNYQGEMLNFQTKTMDLCVTPYHRMYAQHYKKNKEPELALNKSKTDLIQASDIKRGVHRQFRTGYLWDGISKNIFVIPSTEVNNGHEDIIKPEIKIDMANWLKFFGLWLADGYCRHTKNIFGKFRYTVGIKQQDKNKEKMIEVFNGLPFKYSIYQEKGTDKSNYEIHSKQLWEYLVKFGKSKDKYVPSEIKELDINLLKIFMDYYLFGDSHKIKNGSICLSTMSKQLSEDLQEIVLKLGDVIQFTEKDLIMRNKNYGKFYVAYWNINKMKNSKYPTPNKFMYNGIIFCPELNKNGVMLIRRNNKICFSGNTNKRAIFERAMSFNKPFALMFSMTWLNDSAPKQIFIERNKQMQILMFDKRIKFLNNGIIQNKITFSSGYLCWDFLQKDIICENLVIE